MIGSLVSGISLVFRISRRGSALWAEFVGLEGRLSQTRRCTAGTRQVRSKFGLDHSKSELLCNSSWLLCNSPELLCNSPELLCNSPELLCNRSGLLLSSSELMRTRRSRQPKASLPHLYGAGLCLQTGYFLMGAVRTSGAPSVMATVCSQWQAIVPSALTMVQGSSSMWRTSPPP